MATRIHAMGRTMAYAVRSLVLLIPWFIHSHGFQVSTFYSTTTTPSLPTTPSTTNDGVVDGTDPQPKHTEDELIALAQQRLGGFFSFPLDDWQLYAGGAITEGYNVVVSAPTGAGKTVIGEMALHWAILQNQKGIYTTPLKALSNEKYRDFCAIYGRPNVGLSTGDVSINKGATVSIMTTEVYRNIAWRSSLPMEADDLVETSVAVLDELHYMGHPGRGGVWEESIVTTPSHTQLLGLSATLANGEDICAWMQSVTQRPTVLVQVPGNQRPVPLRYLFATRDGLHPLFRDPDAGPGAPHGLLGLRGDGVDFFAKKSHKRHTKNKGFANMAADLAGSTLPKGLEVNPILLQATEKRMKKIDRAMDRQMQLRRSTTDRTDEYSPRRKMQVRKPSKREVRQERERLLKKEMRRSVPSLHALIERLRRKDLLPAIFFIFSRAGCDQAAQSVARSMMSSAGFDRLLEDGIPGGEYEPESRPRKRSGRQRSKRKQDLLQDKKGRSFRKDGNFVNEDILFDTLMTDFDDSAIETIKEDGDDLVLSRAKHPFYSAAGLLELVEVREVASAIIAFNERNEELAFEEDVMEHLLLGLGSHHAGMLPAHKSFVELLYQRQLMKVVFATETLAAGINMPARTTVICSMAKRGDGSSMNLLDTSNLLQMAGRAGRRGKDAEGTCVIVTTPFESHDEAAKILTDPIKPISSQFSPSYSLCVNLIARGEGRLYVAKQLVSQSFAMWETSRNSLKEVDEVQAASQTTLFFELLLALLQDQSGDDSLTIALELLNGNTKGLKRAAKSLTASTSMLGLEQATLSYLESTLKGDATTNNQPELSLLVTDDDSLDIKEQIAQQQERVNIAADELKIHPFSRAAEAVNLTIRKQDDRGVCLANALKEARGETGKADEAVLDGLELASIARTASQQKKVADESTQGTDEAGTTSWNDFVSITNTLVEYGCLLHTSESSDDVEDSKKRFDVTIAGEQVGLLGFENSLWNLVALGGAWEHEDPSAQRDDDVATNVSELFSSTNSRELVETLLSLTPSQLAGFVSCLVPTNSRDSNASMLQQFQQLDSKLQQAIRQAFTVSDRMSEIQRANGVSELMVCPVDISNCAVVTAWADGCSWSEAMELSGLAAGDLARTLSRVLDALRQLGNLPYDPLRRSDVEIEHQFGRAPRGLDPRLKVTCREACGEINRYPLKDSLIFNEEDEDEEENDDAEIDGEHGPQSDDELESE